MRLYAAIMTEETDVPETINLKGIDKAQKQVDRLADAVAHASYMIRGMQGESPATSYQCVFLAPEYFFSNQRHADARFFSHDVKRVILGKLAALAKKHPDILIIPGTILWTKDAYDTSPPRWVRARPTAKGGPQRRRGEHADPKAAEAFMEKFNQDAARLQKDAARLQKVDDRRQAAQNNFGTMIDGTPPEAKYGTGHGSGWGHSGQPDASAEDLLKNRDAKIAQNVAYVCLGDTMLKYHKVGNYQEVRGEQELLLFAPGSIVGRFAVGGVQYGLEICMDHAMGVLEKATDFGDVHVRLVVSGHVNVNSVNAPLLLHSSTHAPSQHVKTAPALAGHPGVTLAQGLAHNPVKVGSLTVAALDLDEAKLGIGNTSRTLSSVHLSEVKHA
jgi:predicted amidohydrolase